MRVFECRTYVLIPKEKMLKWDLKARAGVFMGHENVSKAYRVYDVETRQIVISRDVNFDKLSISLSTGHSSHDEEDISVWILNVSKSATTMWVRQISGWVESARIT